MTTDIKDINSPLIKGYRHVLELPNGWFVMVDMREDSDPWHVSVLDSTGEHIQGVYVPAKVLKGTR